MRRTFKVAVLFLLLTAIAGLNAGFGQAHMLKPLTQRQKQRRAMHLRDSLLRVINRSDTSVSTLLRKVEQYTTLFNQINNNLAEGLDTSEVSDQLPAVIRRLNKIDTLTNTHKSSTLRYLFVLRDNLDRIQDVLQGWQGDLDVIDTNLIQNQTDLNKFYKDTLLKAAPTDSLLRGTFFKQRKTLFLLWKKTDAANRGDLSKVNYLQDKLAVAFTNLLDETDHIDSKISKFADKAINGELGYIWESDQQYSDSRSAFNSTIKVNSILFNYFIKNEGFTHFMGLMFLILIFTWITVNRIKVKHNAEFSATLPGQVNYIFNRPIISSLLVATTIVPYFYSHPPVVFTETLFLFPMIFALVFVKHEFPASLYNFLRRLFLLTLIYGVSNLFIEISNFDRFAILGLSILSLLIGVQFLKQLKTSNEGQLPYTVLVMRIFVGLQGLSLLLNISGRFALAKILGITAVFNLWMLIILYFVVQIVSQGLYLQFQTKKNGHSLLSWVDYTVVGEKFRKLLTVMAALVWTFFLLQNLNLDDAMRDYISDFLIQPHTVGGASFTFEGFVIFIAVIWLSSIISKIISYFYDVSALRATDLSVLKKKNRTSTLLIRLAVFSIGFVLAVAASNFPLDKITIIISAFGIGIGFGLQNIVNNLVSGLILAFEKPVQIGDIIEIDTRSGTIKEIGIRSSRIATADGAEVIIPNADLISHHVINWTLSNSNRRIELIIGVAYGSDAAQVKKILEDILGNRDDIMSDPAPAVFLHNLNESSVDFRMFFWAADINTWLGLKSRVLADIYTTFAKEGIDIPFPTRDLYLHYDEKPTEEANKDEPAPGNPKLATDSNKPGDGLEDVKH